ncbi:MAG: hypothetical protein AAF556_01175 [Pseudomonadota bacterium]
MFAKLTSQTPSADASAIKVIGFIKGIDIDGQAPGQDGHGARRAAAELATEITDQLRFGSKQMDPQQQQFLSEALPTLRKLGTMRSGHKDPIVGAATEAPWKPDPFWMETAAELKDGMVKRAEALMEARFMPSVEADREAGTTPTAPANITAHKIATAMGR